MRLRRADEPLDLLHDATRLDRLGQVAIAAGLLCLLAVLFEGVRGERDDGDAAGGRIGLEALRGFPAIHLGDRDVHEDEVGKGAARQLHGLDTVLGLDDVVAEMPEHG